MFYLVSLVDAVDLFQVFFELKCTGGRKRRKPSLSHLPTGPCRRLDYSLRWTRQEREHKFRSKNRYDCRFAVINLYVSSCDRTFTEVMNSDDQPRNQIGKTEKSWWEVIRRYPLRCTWVKSLSTRKSLNEFQKSTVVPNPTSPLCSDSRGNI